MSIYQVSNPAAYGRSLERRIYLEDTQNYEEYLQKIMNLPEGDRLVKVVTQSGYHNGSNAGAGGWYYNIPSEWQKIKSSSRANDGATEYTTIYSVPDGDYRIHKTSSICENAYSSHLETKEIWISMKNGYLLYSKEEYDEMKSFFIHHEESERKRNEFHFLLSKYSLQKQEVRDWRNYDIEDMAPIYTREKLFCIKLLTYKMQKSSYRYREDNGNAEEISVLVFPRELWVDKTEIKEMRVGDEVIDHHTIHSVILPKVPPGKRSLEILWKDGRRSFFINESGSSDPNSFYWNLITEK